MERKGEAGWYGRRGLRGAYLNSFQYSLIVFEHFSSLGQCALIKCWDRRRDGFAVSYALMYLWHRTTYRKLGLEPICCTILLIPKVLSETFWPSSESFLDCDSSYLSLLFPFQNFLCRSVTNSWSMRRRGWGRFSLIHLLLSVTYFRRRPWPRRVLSCGRETCRSSFQQSFLGPDKIKTGLSRKVLLPPLKIVPIWRVSYGRSCITIAPVSSSFQLPVGNL